MAYQAVFKRYELKFLLTSKQKDQILQASKPYMTPDQYGRSTVRNLYFDTESYRLIRRSLERPTYKEKLRLRSYERAGPDSPIFVELKKKISVCGIQKAGIHDPAAGFGLAARRKALPSRKPNHQRN